MALFFSSTRKNQMTPEVYIYYSSLAFTYYYLFINHPSPWFSRNAPLVNACPPFSKFLRRVAMSLSWIQTNLCETQRKRKVQEEDGTI
jgi:hypothetical protein